LSAARPLLVAGHADDATRVELRDLDGRQVSWCTVAGGKRHGAINTRGAATLERGVRLAIERGVPAVIVLDTGGADIIEGVPALMGWGRVAAALSAASGVVPTVVAVTGACVSGPALLLGLADAVVMTAEAFAYVSGPDAVEAFTGIAVSRVDLGGAGMHQTTSGVTTLVVTDELEIEAAVGDLLSYLPANHLADPPRHDTDDVTDRDCATAAATVPTTASAAYDVRTVVGDVLDADSFLELRALHSPNLVIGFGRLDGRSVGIIANQPCFRAGTLDIDASRKAARFVSWCDAFNVPLLTFVDTPGFEPGRDLEWRGMIRHGAQLVHAYCAATVPRVCVILRKAYGGAYIVMDSRGIGNDLCLAWPCAEIAVMGAAPAVQILGSKGVTEESFEDAFLNPWRAAERGFVDEVIAPVDTRRAVTAAFAAFVTKRDLGHTRKHSNGPL
jgi:acetyl-CoA carboxylase carboxyltransferase component